MEEGPYRRARRQACGRVLIAPADIIQRDDGRFALGWGDDAPGPFESRAFAAAVAANLQRSARRQGVHENPKGS